MRIITDWRNGGFSYEEGIRIFDGSLSAAGRGALAEQVDQNDTLVIYFSCTGTTRGVAEKLANVTGADLYEIVPAVPYTEEDLNYNDRSTRATSEQDHPETRPEIGGEDVDLTGYSTVYIGYPNWWASIPMPIASFLEQYDFSGKRIVPFCSHGGGRFGQSLTAIAKLAPESNMGQGLSVHYSGGSTLSGDVAAWLEANHLKPEA